MSLSLTKMAILTGYAHSISLKGFETNRLFHRHRCWYYQRYSRV